MKTDFTNWFWVLLIISIGLVALMYTVYLKQLQLDVSVAAFPDDADLKFRRSSADRIYWILGPFASILVPCTVYCGYLKFSANPASDQSRGR